MPVQVDELGYLPIGRLVIRQRMQTGDGFPLQQFVARHRHPDRTHRRVTPEYGRIPALLRAIPRRRGQNSSGCQIPLQ